MTPSERLAQLGLTSEEIRKAHKRVVKFAASNLIEIHGNKAIGISIDGCISTMHGESGNHFWSRVLHEVKIQLGADDGGWKN